MRKRGAKEKKNTVAAPDSLNTIEPDKETMLVIQRCRRNVGCRNGPNDLAVAPAMLGRIRNCWEKTRLAIHPNISFPPLTIF